MTLNGKKREVSAGTFIHLPPWCEHGVENTGEETALEILIYRHLIHEINHSFCEFTWNKVRL